MFDLEKNAGDNHWNSTKKKRKQFVLGYALIHVMSVMYVSTPKCCNKETNVNVVCSYCLNVWGIK